MLNGEERGIRKEIIDEKKGAQGKTVKVKMKPEILNQSVRFY